MSAHGDKTLHRKIYNINDTDTFPPYPFIKNVTFGHEFVKEFFTDFGNEFKYEIRTNSYECFARIIGCYEWPVLYMKVNSSQKFGKCRLQLDQDWYRLIILIKNQHGFVWQAVVTIIR